MTNFVSLVFARIGALITMERYNDFRLFVVCQNRCQLLWREMTSFVSLMFARIGASITMETNNEFRFFVVCQNRCFNIYGEKY